MKFKKEDLQEMVCEDSLELTHIKDKIIDAGRWSIHHSVVFQYENRYFRTVYSVGATEYQDERPFQEDPDLIECTEVVRVERRVWDYVPKVPHAHGISKAPKAPTVSLTDPITLSHMDLRGDIQSV